MHGISWRVAVVVLLFGVYSCDSDESQPYPYEVLVQGEYSGYHQPIERVIETQEEWQRFWEIHTAYLQPPPTLPAADFDRSVLAVIYGGDRPTNGYSVNILSVTQEKMDVTIRYRIQGAGPALVITQPHIILELPKTPGNIRFGQL